MESKATLVSQRVYALDALRGIMMLLGIVLHAAVTYGSIDYQSAWPLNSPEHSAVYDIIVAYIHVFRMPVFFLAAGFFAALLYYRKGSEAMLANRLKRIFIPFIVGVLTIYPMIVFAFNYTTLSFMGAPSPLATAWNSILSGDFLPFNVAHLWFLYFLTIFALIGWFLAKIFERIPRVSAPLSRFTKVVMSRLWIRILVMAIPFFGCLYWMGTHYIITNNSWAINPSTLTVYFLFFGTGWLIYTSDTLNYMDKYPKTLLSVATILFFYSLFTQPPLIYAMMMASFYGTLFIYGFLALFMKYFNSYSERLGYLLDASYWIYVIHLPIVAFIPGLMEGLAIPLFLKFLINVILTSVICLATYKYLVRGSVVGFMLNGKIVRQNQEYRTLVRA